MVTVERNKEWRIKVDGGGEPLISIQVWGVEATPKCEGPEGPDYKP